MFLFLLGFFLYISKYRLISSTFREDGVGPTVYDYSLQELGNRIDNSANSLIQLLESI